MCAHVRLPPAALNQAVIPPQKFDNAAARHVFKAVAISRSGDFVKLDNLSDAASRIILVDIKKKAHRSKSLPCVKRNYVSESATEDPARNLLFFPCLTRSKNCSLDGLSVLLRSQHATFWSRLAAGGSLHMPRIKDCRPALPLVPRPHLIFALDGFVKSAHV